MAIKAPTTTHGASKLPTWQLIAVIGSPIWIILATYANALIGGEVTL
jgi:hypothetical protein